MFIFEMKMFAVSYIIVQCKRALILVCNKSILYGTMKYYSHINIYYLQQACEGE